MKFTLEINCDNAAFDGPDLYLELARILRRKAEQLEGGDAYPSVRDTNGNRVGSMYLGGDDSD